jgi:hypothetical protein
MIERWREKERERETVDEGFKSRGGLAGALLALCWLARRHDGSEFQSRATMDAMAIGVRGMIQSLESIWIGACTAPDSSLIRCS